LGADGTARMSVQNCTRPLHSCLGLWVVAGSDWDVRQLRNPVRTQSWDIENFRVRGEFLHFGVDGTAGISVKSCARLAHSFLGLRVVVKLDWDVPDLISSSHGIFGT
jgi:hypothetical protein